MRNFLQNGNLHTLRVGMTLEETLTLLGKPEDVGCIKKKDNSGILAYSDYCLQISYQQGVVSYIAIEFVRYNDHPPALPAVIAQSVTIPFTHSTTPDEFIAYLTQHHISWIRQTEYAAEADDMVIRILTAKDKRITIHFQDGQLDSMYSQ
ncbi:MAG TPA: hypothetical protein VK970_04160 [Candidatus Methylacidiphilales bacterium]|nr:hypothetical protein [Candidatus Methylacidiphilales bacterium]